MPPARRDALERVLAAAWRLDRILAESRALARALAMALGLRLAPDLSLDLEVDVVRRLDRALRGPLAFDATDVLHAGRPGGVRVALGHDIARELDRAQSLDRAHGVLRDIARHDRRRVARSRARRLGRSLNQARSASRELEHALRQVRAAITAADPHVMPMATPLLEWMARLLPPDFRARFVEEQSANLAFAGRGERVIALAELVLAMPRYAWSVNRGRSRLTIDDDPGI